MPKKQASQTDAELAAHKANEALRAAISDANDALRAATNEVEAALDKVRVALDLPPRDRWVVRTFANPESRAKFARFLREACMEAERDHFTPRRGPFGR